MLYVIPSISNTSIIGASSTRFAAALESILIMVRRFLNLWGEVRLWPAGYGLRDAVDPADGLDGRGHVASAERDRDDGLRGRGMRNRRRRGLDRASDEHATPE